MPKGNIMESSTPLSLMSRVAVSPDLVACNVADEVVILSLRSGEYHGLNDVAASLWALLQEPVTVRELRDSLLEEYEGVSAETCEQEVLSTLSRMCELELVEVL